MDGFELDLVDVYVLGTEGFFMGGRILFSPVRPARMTVWWRPYMVVCPVRGIVLKEWRCTIGQRSLVLAVIIQRFIFSWEGLRRPGFEKPCHSFELTVYLRCRWIDSLAGEFCSVLTLCFIVKWHRFSVFGNWFSTCGGYFKHIIGGWACCGSAV